MKLSVIIQELQNYQTELGDVEVFAEVSDGRSTWAAPYNPSLKYREIWKDHPSGKRFFLSSIPSW